MAPLRAWLSGRAVRAARGDSFLVSPSRQGRRRSCPRERTPLAAGIRRRVRRCMSVMDEPRESEGVARDPSGPVEEWTVAHPLDPITETEVRIAARTVRASLGDHAELVRFNIIDVVEPEKALVLAHGGEAVESRTVTVTYQLPEEGRAFKATVEVNSTGDGAISSTTELVGIQPLLSPDDCELAEEIVKSSSSVRSLLEKRYGIDISTVACDPWSVHCTGSEPFDTSKRLVQTFLYSRDSGPGGEVSNAYAHPLDALPVVDLDTRQVVDLGVQGSTESLDTVEAPRENYNYHPTLLGGNRLPGTLSQEREGFSVPKPLEIVQPEGPSFQVEGHLVKWDKWQLRVGFNHREGLVLHDVRYDGDLVLWRGSLVEMAVPYADPEPPFHRKCAFDVGDYGLGYCTDSLSLGCDCLGDIHYFDATMSDSKGEPYVVKKAVCMHEEDDGILWKHVEYRTGHNQSRRSRKLVLSFIATVVNYEYLFYWYLKQDGSISLEIKLSGMLSTNYILPGRKPDHGTLVAPSVNA